MQARGAGSIVLLLLLLGTAVQAQTRYISDELIVPLRTGPTIRNAITRNLRAGTMVEVLEQQEDSGYSRVRLADRDIEGWLETQYLVAEPIARDRLAAAERDRDAARDEAAELEVRVEQLTAELERAQAEIGSIREARGELSEELKDVREASADVLAIRDENTRLESQLRASRLEVEALKVQNGELANRERQNWFVVGAAVLTGGIVIGLVLPSLRRRRRSDW